MTLYIDDIDIRSTIGLGVADQGYNDVISWPSIKPVARVDWHEEDGVIPDLTAPRLSSKGCGIKLCGRTSYAKLQQLIELLSDGAYHTFSFAERINTLRLTAVDPPLWCDDLCVITLWFSEDDPMADYTYSAPISTLDDDSYILDGISLAKYGVKLLEGSYGEITRTPDVKTNLLQDLSAKNGVLYDNEVVRYKDYTATLRCLMRAETLSNLWRNYDALLYDLLRSGGHTLQVTSVAKKYPCYYEDCRVTRFFGEHKIWLEFDLTLCVYTTPTSIQI